MKGPQKPLRIKVYCKLLSSISLPLGGPGVWQMILSSVSISCLFAYSHPCMLGSSHTHMLSVASAEVPCISCFQVFSSDTLSLWMLPQESVPLSCLFLRLWFTLPLFTGFSVLFWPGCPFSPSCSHGTLCRHHLSRRRHRDYLLIRSSKF